MGVFGLNAGIIRSGAQLGSMGPLGADRGSAPLDLTT